MQCSIILLSCFTTYQKYRMDIKIEMNELYSIAYLHSQVGFSSDNADLMPLGIIEVDPFDR